MRTQAEVPAALDWFKGGCKKDEETEATSDLYRTVYWQCNARHLLTWMLGGEGIRLQEEEKGS